MLCLIKKEIKMLLHVLQKCVLVLSYLLSALSSLWSGEGTAVLLSTAAEYGKNPLSDLCPVAVQVKSELAPLEPSAVAA